MSASPNEPHTGFGVPERPGVHHFRVEIPRKNSEPVLVVESFGDAGGHGGVPAEEARVRLERERWSKVRDAAKKAFNPRLREAKLPAGKWTTGEVRVDRILGRELCVLLWAAEHVEVEHAPVLCARWLALRPEERWWLFAVTVAEAGLPGDRQRGWRRALGLALGDPGAASAGGVRSHARARPPEDRPLLFPGATTLAS